MALQIIRNDLLKMNVDAIVNPTDYCLSGSASIDKKIHDLGGLNALYISNILIFIAIGISFYFINLKRNKSYFLSLLFSILAVIMLARFITMRAQLITYLLFLIEIYRKNTYSHI